MSYTSTPIALRPEEKADLESWVRSSKTEQRMVLRSRIILLASTGLGTNEIAARLSRRRATVSKWRTPPASDCRRRKQSHKQGDLLHFAFPLYRTWVRDQVTSTPSEVSVQL